MNRMMSEKQFKKMLRGVAQDTKGDGHELDQVATDVADCLLYDPDVKAYMERHYPKEKREIWRDIIADLIVE